MKERADTIVRAHFASQASRRVYPGASRDEIFQAKRRDKPGGSLAN
jgi:hypothetical protein